MNRQHGWLVVAIVIAAVAGLDAQGTATLVRQGQGVRFAEPWRPNAGKGETKIIGHVIDIRQMPVGRVRVQLRNLANGTVEDETESGEDGEYQFDVDEPGTYVVEMVMVDGYIVALSNAGSLGRNETLQTVVMLPGRWDSVARGMVMPQNVSSFVGMSAQTTMTAQTLAIALEQSIQPVDSGQPVSPFTP